MNAKIFGKKSVAKHDAFGFPASTPFRDWGGECNLLGNPSVILNGFPQWRHCHSEWSAATEESSDDLDGILRPACGGDSE